MYIEISFYIEVVKKWYYIDVINYLLILIYNNTLNKL